MSIEGQIAVFCVIPKKEGLEIADEFVKKRTAKMQCRDPGR